MSQLITIRTQDGIVMAADSRITYSGDRAPYYLDSANKLFLTQSNVGISTCGNAGIDNKRIEFYIEDFIEENSQCNAEEIANKIIPYFKGLRNDLNTTFHVCDYSRCFRVYTKSEQVLDCNDTFNPCGIVWNGDNYVVSRLLNGYFCINNEGNPGDKGAYRQVPWEKFKIIDAIEFIKFAMETAIKMQRFHQEEHTIGGEIKILSISSKGAQWH